MLKKNIAKSPAATRNITTFAARTVRTRKMLRRTSGSAERRSMTTNATSSAMASAKNPPVCSDVQPFSCALTIPYTSASRPAVTVTAPATS